MDVGVRWLRQLAAIVLLSVGLVIAGAGAACGAGALASIEVSPSHVTMPVGGTQEFTVLGKDSQGNPVPLADPRVEGTGGTMTLSQDPVAFHATVSYEAGQQSGGFYFEVWDAMVTGPPGTAGAIWGSADMTIATTAPTQLGRIDLGPSAVTLDVGDRETFTVTGWDQLGNPYDDFDSVLWSASSRVDLVPSNVSQCEIAVTEPGDHTVRCTVTSKTITLVEAVAIHVERGSPELSGISISPSDVTLTGGDQQVFTVTGRDQYGDPYGGFDSVTWSNSGDGGISASSNTCVYTARGVGEDAVTCTVTVGDAVYQDTATICIDEPELSGISISPSEVTLTGGDQQVFTVTGRDQYGDPYGDFEHEWEATGGSITPRGIYTAGCRPGSYRVIVRVQGRGFVARSWVRITGITCGDSRVTITCQDVSEDTPGAAPADDLASQPLGVDWTSAKGFHVVATGPDGEYDFTITFAGPVGTGSRLLERPAWREVPYTVTGENTISVRLKIANGTLDSALVLVRVQEQSPTGTGLQTPGSE